MIPLTDDVPERKPGDFRRDTRGTPYVTHPTKRTAKGEPAWERYSRPSGYHHQIEDGYNLVKWDERNIVLGLAGEVAVIINSPDATIAEGSALDRLINLHGGNIDDTEWRKQADGVVAAAKRAAKSMLAAERGTHAHEITDGTPWLTRAEAGEDLGLPTAVQAAIVATWHALIDEHGLEILATELPVVHDGYRCAGTLDHIGRLTKPLSFVIDGEVVELPAGTVLVLDKKTGKLTLDERDGQVLWWQGYAVQTAIYAGAVPYDTTTDRRVRWGDALGVHVPEGEYLIDQRYALIAHLPVTDALDGHPTARLVLVDLAKGRAAADLCKAAKQWERDRAVFGLGYQTDAPPTDAAPDVATLRARLAALDEATAAAFRTQWAWPKLDDCTPADLAAIEAELNRATSGPFVPVEQTRPTPTNPITRPTGTPHPQWVRPDEGPTLDPATTEALRATIGRLEATQAAMVRTWLRDAAAAGRRVGHLDDGTVVHTVRSLEQIRAAIALAAAWDDLDTDGTHLYLTATLGEPSTSIGAAIGTLTVDQARQLADAATAHMAGVPPIRFDDTGTPVLAAT